MKKKSPAHFGLVCVFSFLLLFVYSCKKLSPAKETQVLQEEFPTGSPGGGGMKPIQL